MINFLKDEYSFHIFHVDKIDSTNTFFKNHYVNYLDDSILIANHQSSGRGRYTREWIDDDDLLFSILTKKQRRYEIIAPLSVMFALRDYSIKAFIKWPNDIFVDDKKISGILIEDIFNNSDFICSIIGIGINFTRKDKYISTGVNDYLLLDKTSLFDRILFHLNRCYSMDENSLLDEYKKNNLCMNRKISFKNKEYKITNFTKEGYLIGEGDDKIIIRSDEIDIKSCLEV